MAIESRYVVSIETAKQIWQTEKVFAYTPDGNEFIIESEADMNHVIEHGYAVSVEQSK